MIGRDQIPYTCSSGQGRPLQLTIWTEKRAESKFDQSLTTGSKEIDISRAEYKETYNEHKPPASPDHRPRDMPTFTKSPSRMRASSIVLLLEGYPVIFPQI